MPQIIVLADAARDQGEGAVMLRERVSLADLESDHFATQLVERLGWAVGDAQEVERTVVAQGSRQRGPERRSARVVTTAS